MKNREEFSNLLEKIDPEREKGFYYHVGSAPVLIIAPHAGRKIIEPLPGKKINLREFGTDVLTVIAADAIDASFIVVEVPRDEADFARDPATLGKGDKAVLSAGGQLVWIKTNKNIEWASTLHKFHSLIERIDPAFILTYHGMRNKKWDVVLGFGRERKYIGGWKNAFRFKKTVLEKMREAGYPQTLVGVSKFKLTGESDYILNRNHRNGKLSGLVEFNVRGRRTFPTEEYQTLAIKIAETAKEWVS